MLHKVAGRACYGAPFLPTMMIGAVMVYAKKFMAMNMIATILIPKGVVFPIALPVAGLPPPVIRTVSTLGRRWS